MKADIEFFETGTSTEVLQIKFNEDTFILSTIEGTYTLYYVVDKTQQVFDGTLVACLREAAKVLGE